MNENNNVKALKSGVWYIVANFITKSMVFLSTPIFSRLLTHEEYGLYSNYTSWLSTFSVFVTLNMSATYISARFDYKDTFDSYISSTAFLSVLSTLFWTIIINVLSQQFVLLTGIDIKYLNIMAFYMMFTAVIEMFQTRERYYYKYKKSVALSLLVSIGSTILSILLVNVMSNRLEGRIIGNSAVSIFLGQLILIYIFMKGKTVKIEHWKYALPICLPYIPHLLSLTILNSVDRIMITKICGAEENALYTLAYSCGAIITLLITSMNTAFVPWLGEKLENDSLQEVHEFSKIYIKAFAFFSCGLMLISPEVLLIMGGKGYYRALFVMPPVAFGFICQFMYTMFVNVEQFKKKTMGMALASISAAVINYILNAIFISRFGFIAAAYTTSIGFLWLLLIHMILVYRMGLMRIYSAKTILYTLLFAAIFTIIVSALYKSTIARYLTIVLYGILLLNLMRYHYKNIIRVFRKSR